MGTISRVALSTPILVLLCATVAPAVLAVDPIGTVRHAADEQARGAQEHADQAQAQANRAADDAQHQIDDEQERAQAAAGRAHDDASSRFADISGLALFLVDIGVRFVDNTVGIARDTATDLLGSFTDLTRTRQGADHEGGYSAQSSDFAIARTGLSAPLVWIAASAGGILLLMIVARKLVALGAIPLLSRIAHDEIYNNDARRTIHELVVSEAGLCLNELVSRTGYSRNAVSYHLFVLEKEEEIVSVKDGKYRRYFNRNGKYVNGAKNVVAALRNETTLKLARAVLARPGSIQRDLCVELGATPSATCWHAKRLLDLGVIRKERVANTVQYFPGEAMAKYDLSDMGLARAASPVPMS